MTDLAVLAWGFGSIPLASVLLYVVADAIGRHREAAWGILAGVVGFLGLSHAMAVVLVNHSLLGDELLAILLPVVGLATGGAAAWILFEGPFTRMEQNRILGAAVMFLAIHSFGDGLALGAGFVGGLTPAVPVDGVTVSATVLHRFAEGSLVIIPALTAAWRPRSSFPLLLASLVAVPAAYLPNWMFEVLGPSPIRSTFGLGVPTFVAATEASFALVLVVRGFLPIASAERGTRWIVWTLLGFVGISLVHFLVE